MPEYPDPANIADRDVLVQQIALQRAVDADPDYSMARLLLGAIDRGLSLRAILDAIALAVADDVVEGTDQLVPDVGGDAASGTGSRL